MRLFVCILTALSLSVLGLDIPKPRKLHEDIQLEKKEGYYIYTTKKMCALSTCSDEPDRYSHCLKGHLPRGIRMYGFSKGFCFRYNNRNEVIIIPKLTETELSKTPQTVSLLELETGQYCMDNYDSLCPDYTLFDRLFSPKHKFPIDHIAYILRGDIADIYVIARKENMIEMLSIIISGCKGTDDFLSQWHSIESL